MKRFNVLCVIALSVLLGGCLGGFGTTEELYEGDSGEKIVIDALAYNCYNYDSIGLRSEGVDDHFVVDMVSQDKKLSYHIATLKDDGTKNDFLTMAFHGVSKGVYIVTFSGPFGPADSPIKQIIFFAEVSEVSVAFFFYRKNARMDALAKQHAVLVVEEGPDFALFGPPENQRKFLLALMSDRTDAYIKRECKPVTS